LSRDENAIIEQAFAIIEPFFIILSGNKRQGLRFTVIAEQRPTVESAGSKLDGYSYHVLDYRLRRAIILLPDTSLFH